MEETVIKISDCAIVTQGKNIDKKFLNTEQKGLPYIVGASCLKDSGFICERYTEYPEKSEISHLGDVIISTVGTLGKMAVNNIGTCVLSKHVCAVRLYRRYCRNMVCCALWLRSRNVSRPMTECKRDFREGLIFPILKTCR